jgi:hypothetical protein
MRGKRSQKSARWGSPSLRRSSIRQAPGLRGFRPVGIFYRGAPEATAGISIRGGDETQPFESRLDGAQSAAVSYRDVRHGVATCERGGQLAFFLLGPGSADVVGQLRAALRANGHLFNRGDPDEQCSQDFDLLQDRSAWELLAAQGIDTLNQCLKNFSRPLFLHENLP